jgi:hypothetical protein
VKDVISRLEAMKPSDEALAEDRGGTKQQRLKLVEAVRALLDGRPSHPTLREVLRVEGRVPITKNTVEIEAGVDRRRFSGPKSDHPELSAILKELKPDHGVGKTTGERLKKQSATITKLKQQLIASRSATAAQTARIEALRAELKTTKARLARLVKEDEESD